MVWAAYHDEEHGHAPDRCEQIVGAPDSGVGARHVHLGKPAPPYGLRTVMYTEVVAQEEGHWISLQTHAGAWQHEETWHFVDRPGGTTTARITGEHVRPYGTASPGAIQTALTTLAQDALDRLAARVEGRA